MTKAALIKLLEKYPDDTTIEITVSSRDLEESTKSGNGFTDSENAISFYTLGLPGDHSYDEEEGAIALQVWGK